MKKPGSEPDNNRILSEPRDLPSVEALVRDRTLSEARARYGTRLLTEAVREALDRARSALKGGGGGGVVTLEAIVSSVTRGLEDLLSGGIRPVINATGTVLHTNLGRAVLAEEAIRGAERAGSAYTNLEFDVDKGARGERDGFCVSLIKRLTGCEEASIVNNNAAALLITLNTLAEGREVIISRGELIEIGGSFRLPEIIKKSGAIIREVGTTNRTHRADYEGAMNERTALILKVHTSNYIIEGFTSEVGLRELAALGAERGIPVVEDLGAGALIDLTDLGLPREPLVSESLGAGAHVVTFSGDKLLGGPQAGLIAGKAHVVGRIRKNPMKRALRCGKLTLAALEETLKLYLDPERLPGHLPALGLMTRGLEQINAMAERAVDIMGSDGKAGIKAAVEDGESVIGGGALPGRFLPTRVVVMTGGPGAAKIQRAFLDGRPPVVGRIHRDAFILDPRTVLDEGGFLSAIEEVLERLDTG